MAGIGRALAVACACALGVYWLQLPRLQPPVAARLDEPFLPSPERIVRFTFGWRNLLADAYWLGYVQYFGDTEARERSGYGRSADYLEVVTALNPAFLYAYAQANYAVAEAMADPARSAAFLEQGAVRNPGQPDRLGMPGTWYLYRLAGSVVFRHFHDYRRAARLFEQAAAEPGAPAVMRENAAAFYAAASDRERAIRLWQEFYRLAPTPAMRASARRHLAALGVR